MHNVSIVTPLRNATEHLDAFFECYDALWRGFTNYQLIMVEGDSQDDSWNSIIQKVRTDHSIRVAKFETGVPKHGSVVDAERFKQLSRVFNKCLSLVDLDWSDYVLMWPVDIEIPRDLVDRLIAHNRALISLFVFNKSSGLFYDTWAFTQLSGSSFENFPLSDLEARYGRNPIAMSAIGGVMLMKAAAMRAGLYYPERDVDRGLCSLAISLGYSCWADPSTVVWHR